jgi:hypothetical protein
MPSTRVTRRKESSFGATMKGRTGGLECEGQSPGGLVFPILNRSMVRTLAQLQFLPDHFSGLKVLPQHGLAKPVLELLARPSNQNTERNPEPPDRRRGALLGPRLETAAVPLDAVGPIFGASPGTQFVPRRVHRGSRRLIN